MHAISANACNYREECSGRCYGTMQKILLTKDKFLRCLMLYCCSGGGGGSRSSSSAKGRLDAKAQEDRTPPCFSRLP